MQRSESGSHGSTSSRDSKRARLMESTFFFVVLPDGRTVTADVPLSLTCHELLAHLAKKHSGLASSSADDGAPYLRCLYVVVGRHRMEADQTLADAGVTRDRTLQLRMRVSSMVSSNTHRANPGPTALEQHSSVGHLLAQLRMPGGHTELVRLRVLKGLHGPLDKVMMGLKAGNAGVKGQACRLSVPSSQDINDMLRVVAVCCEVCSAACSPSLYQVALAWLLDIAEWAAGVLTARPGMQQDGTQGADATQHCMSCYLTACKAAEVLELWLSSVAAYVMAACYSRCTSGQQGMDNPPISRPSLFEILDPLVTWLAQQPLHKLPKLPESAHCFAFSVELLSGRCWTSTGQTALLAMKADLGCDQLHGVAALLQAITLLVADYNLSCLQMRLSPVPGMPQQLLRPAVAEQCAAAAPADGHDKGVTAALYTLAHASLMMQPVISTCPYGELQAAAGAAAAAAEGACCCGSSTCCCRSVWDVKGSAGFVVTCVMNMLTASAVARGPTATKESKVGRAGAAATADGTGAATTAACAGELVPMRFQVFGGRNRACWDFLPLLTAALNQIKAFADFAAANAMSHKTLLPQFLAKDGTVFQLAEVWLTLSQLAGDGRAARLGHVSALLQQPVIATWVQKFMKALDPELIELGPKRPEVAAAGALLDLLAWDPSLATALPQSAWQSWLQRAVFAPVVYEDDEDEDEDVLELEVRRDWLLEDSYAQLLNFTPEQLRRPLRVRFKNEDAEGDGVMAEWLVQLAALLFNPAAALFQSSPSNMALAHPSPAAVLQPNWQQYTRLAGRVVGLALRAGVPLGIQLSGAFCKALQATQALPPPFNTLAGLSSEELADQLADRQLQHPWFVAMQATGVVGAARAAATGVSKSVFEAGKCVQLLPASWRQQLELEDLAQLDDQFASSLRYLLDTPGAADDLQLTWTTAVPDGVAAAVAAAVTAAEGCNACEQPAAGYVEVDMVPDGAATAVTEANKRRYVGALLEHKLVGSCIEQVLWFYTGLYDVAQPAAADLARGRLLLPLDVPGFSQLLCGSPAPLNVAEWRAAHRADSTLLQEKRTLKMFWQVVSRLSDDQRRQLLRFWTGITHLPASGFKGLGRKLQLVGYPSSRGIRDTAANGDVANGVVPAAADAAGAAGAGQAQPRGQPAAAAGSRRAFPLVLPTARTCFLQLSLPMCYRNAAEMADALQVALANVNYFGRW